MNSHFGQSSINKLIFPRRGVGYHPFYGHTVDRAKKTKKQKKLLAREHRQHSLVECAIYCKNFILQA